MSGYAPRELYGGAIVSGLPVGWLDASDLRQVPDHQEVFLSKSSLNTLIIEINEYQGPKPTTTTDTTEKQDHEALLYHLNDLIDQTDTLSLTQPPTSIQLSHLPSKKAYTVSAEISIPATARTPASKTSIHLFLIRLPEHDTDLLVHGNVPHQELLKEGGEEQVKLVVEEMRAHVLAVGQKMDIKEWGLFGEEED